jgi:Fe-S-cluster-containing hydrogenase component 2
MKQLRKIIRIDEEKCDGCGRCADACAEGAVRIIGGKARLVSETYCDGLGACIGDCPQGAITIEEREAEEFDAQAVEHHLAGRKPTPASERARPAAALHWQGHACPGSLSQMLQPRQAAPAGAGDAEGDGPAPQLRNWPVQIRLVPIRAPYFQGAHLLIAADCVPFAFADFHRRLLAGKVVLIGCPKLDDVEFYREKLAEIFRQNDIRSVEVAHMEVPCCFGLVQLVRFVLADAGKEIPLILTKIGIRGAICEINRADVRNDDANSVVA